MTLTRQFEELPVVGCGMCREARPHHMPDSGVLICAACGYLRDATERPDPS